MSFASVGQPQAPMSLLDEDFEVIGSDEPISPYEMSLLPPQQQLPPSLAQPSASTSGVQNLPQDCQALRSELAKLRCRQEEWQQTIDDYAKLKSQYSLLINTRERLEEERDELLRQIQQQKQDKNKQTESVVRYKKKPKLSECGISLETTVFNDSIRVSQSVDNMGFCEMLETSDTTMRYKEEPELRDCASFLETSVMMGSVRVKQEIDDMGICEMLLTSDGSVRYKEEPKLDECFTFSETTLLDGAIRVETRVLEAGVQVKQPVVDMGFCEMRLTSDGSVRYKEEPKLDECFTFSETTLLDGAIRVETRVLEAGVQVKQPVVDMGFCEMLLTSDGSVRYKEEPKLDECFTFSETTLLDGAIRVETRVLEAGVQVKQPVVDMGFCEMLLTSDGSVRYKEEPKLDECFTFSETTLLDGAIRVETRVLEAGVQVKQPVVDMGFCEMLLTSDGSVRYKEEPKLDECFTFSETTLLDGAIRVETRVLEAGVQVKQPVVEMGSCEMLLTSDGSVRYKEEPKLDECFTFSETTLLDGAIRVETRVLEAGVQVKQPVVDMGFCEMLLTSDGSVRYKEEPKLDECFTFSETTLLDGAIRVETRVLEAGVQVKQPVVDMGFCEMRLTSDGSVRYKEEPKLDECFTFSETTLLDGAIRVETRVLEAGVQVKQPVVEMGSCEMLLTSDGSVRYKEEPKLDECFTFSETTLLDGAIRVETRVLEAGVQVKQPVVEMGSCEMLLTSDGSVRYKEEPKLDECASFLETTVFNDSIRVSQSVNNMGCWRRSHGLLET
ncbi:hypothetical protein BOX15_Mlig005821g1 [Macrostomum lignano]|uniref:Uncharacterized protein n=1 Tax=Macrostomum lignano TaxID=282301 RepID=A0A267GD91_9PLAT|nr:hypothetical protein BOX15_Mlig005821g1 [Macrostomum lignano]